MVMISRIGMGVALVATTVVAAACGSTSSRVFFVEPKDGATVKPELQVMFGARDLQISAVPSGEVTDSRAGIGHFHVGVDTSCLPVGETIPKADPWIHFGKGTDSADLQLTPGKHTLTVQAGDDMHKTIENACQTITVTVQ
jgi:hypothetical protein